MIKVKNIDFSKYGFCYVEGTSFCGRRSWVLYNKRGIIDVSIGNKGEFRVNHYNQKVLELIIRLVKNHVLNYDKRRYSYEAKYKIINKETNEEITDNKRVGKIETLKSDTLRNYFIPLWKPAKKEKFICEYVIVKDLWEDKIIYKGNDYEEFKEKINDGSQSI